MVVRPGSNISEYLEPVSNNNTGGMAAADDGSIFRLVFELV